MIIGFLKVDKEQSPLANEHPMANVQVAPETNEEKPAEKSPEIKAEKTQTVQVSTPVNTETAEAKAPAPQPQNTSLTITPTSTGTILILKGTLKTYMKGK